MSEFAEREAAVAARKRLLVELIGALPDPALVVDAGAETDGRALDEGGEPVLLERAGRSGGGDRGAG